MWDCCIHDVYMIVSVRIMQYITPGKEKFGLIQSLTRSREMVNWLLEKALILYRFLLPVSFWTFIICILILVPLTLFRRTRGLAGLGFYIGSFIFGISMWVWCAIIALVLGGIGYLIAGILLGGIGVVPIAFFALIFNGEWSVLLQLIVLVIVVFGFRILGVYLGRKSEPSV